MCGGGSVPWLGHGPANGFRAHHVDAVELAAAAEDLEEAGQLARGADHVPGWHHRGPVRLPVSHLNQLTEGNAQSAAHQLREHRHGRPGAVVARHLRFVSGGDATHHAPSGNRGSACDAVHAASRLLPHPPAPVGVSNLVSDRARATSASSRSRPTKLVNSAGRLWGTESTERSGTTIDGPAGPLALTAGSVISAPMRQKHYGGS